MSLSDLSTEGWEDMHQICNNAARSLTTTSTEEYSEDWLHQQLLVAGKELSESRQLLEKAFNISQPGTDELHNARPCSAPEDLTSSLDSWKGTDGVHRMWNNKGKKALMLELVAKAARLRMEVQTATNQCTTATGEVARLQAALDTLHDGLRQHSKSAFLAVVKLETIGASISPANGMQPQHLISCLDQLKSSLCHLLVIDIDHPARPL